ncbi:MAG: Hpt domain [Fibrobacterota bacterium]|jgi:HPt (histidine-containing phosphotransfer) domain-containing protein
MASMDDSPLFDRSTLDDLRKFGQADFIRNMVAVYERSTMDIPERISRMHSAGDWDGIAHQAHSLKSGAGTLGLVRLTKVSGELEAAARAGGGDEADLMVALLPELHKLSGDLLTRFVEGS